MPSNPRSYARRILFGLLAWSAVLALLAAYTELTWSGRHTHRHLRAVLSPWSEQGLVTWTSVVTQCAVGVSCWMLAAQTGRRLWVLAGGFFVFLSIDDQSMLHERLGWASSAEGGALYSWLVVVLPWLGLAGALVLWFVWRETRGTRARQALYATAALWSLALSLEFIEKPLRDSGATWRGIDGFRYTQWVEESCELVAPTLLLAGLVSLLEGARVLQRAEQLSTPLLRDDRRAA